MNHFTIDPLTAWQEELADLTYACACATKAQEVVLLRTARELLEQAPGHWRDHFTGGLTLPALDVLIAAGGAAAAAITMVEGRCGYMLSNAPHCSYVATVVVDGMAGEASASGETVALALLGALAACLAGPVHQAEGGHLADLSSPSLRIN